MIIKSCYGEFGETERQLHVFLALPALLCKKVFTSIASISTSQSFATIFILKICILTDNATNIDDKGIGSHGKGNK